MFPNKTQNQPFPQGPVSFYYSLVLENKIEVLRVLTATKLPLLLGLLS